jgi:hypothetical protein
MANQGFLAFLDARPFEEIGKLDILCGKGLRNNGHPGNIRFNEIVSLYLGDYLSTSSRQAKTKVVQRILRHVEEASNNHSRFFKRSTNGTKWIVITSNRVKRDKIGHALRLAARELYNDGCIEGPFTTSRTNRAAPADKRHMIASSAFFEGPTPMMKLPTRQEAWECAAITNHCPQELVKPTIEDSCFEDQTTRTPPDEYQPQDKAAVAAGSELLTTSPCIMISNDENPLTLDDHDDFFIRDINSLPLMIQDEGASPNAVKEAMDDLFIMEEVEVINSMFQEVLMARRRQPGDKNIIQTSSPPFALLLQQRRPEWVANLIFSSVQFKS